MPYATALCMLENPRLEMAVQSALGFYEDVAYDSGYNGLAFDDSEGERLARALGAEVGAHDGQSRRSGGGQEHCAGLREAVLPGARGTGAGAGLSTGRALKLIPEAIVKKTAAQFAAGGSGGAGATAQSLHFEALKRVLDRAQSDYAS